MYKDCLEVENSGDEEFEIVNRNFPGSVKGNLRLIPKTQGFREEETSFDLSLKLIDGENDSYDIFHKRVLFPHISPSRRYVIYGAMITRLSSPDLLMAVLRTFLIKEGKLSVYLMRQSVVSLLEYGDFVIETYVTMRPYERPKIAELLGV